MSTQSNTAPAGGATPNHAGEQALQTRAGVRERAERAGRRRIRDIMPDEHPAQFANLP
jgi:predicted pyridoxine 5'-phosphate oxidase superfamily flavin-nucleotide-binding protein